MARSSYIYVVHDSAGFPVAAFTVKWELRRWLETFTPEQTAGMIVTRLRDGGRGEPVELVIDEILSEV